MGSNPIGGADLSGTDGTIRKLAKRPSSNLGDLWVRLPLVPLGSCMKGWCSSRRPVKPLPTNCEAVGERFDSFTAHFLSGSVVYWQDTTRRLPCRLFSAVPHPSSLELRTIASLRCSGTHPRYCR